MKLNQIKGIGPSKAKKLQAAGIESVDELARADVAAVAKASGLSEDQVKEYRQAATAHALIADIKGIGPNTLKTLYESGINSLKDLADASRARLAHESQVAKGHLQSWQAEAKRVAEHIRDESKTPEGRRKLAEEGRELAQKAAAATSEKAQELYALAKKEGELAIAKAQELREKAPEVLQDYRKRAEEALHKAEAAVRDVQTKAPEKVKEAQAKAEAAAKEAQAKIAELRVKTEEFVKAETEKVKAANEGFLRGVRNRFSRD